MSTRFFKRMVLIHQTDLECANKIIETQLMIPGTTGLFGGGIYFANTIEAAALKAHKKGVFLCAEVNLGKTISISRDNIPGNLNIAALKAQGYTAITGYRMQSGREIIVFDSKQVSNIKYVYGTRPRAVFQPSVTRVLFFVTSKFHARQIHDNQRIPRIDGPFGQICYLYDSIEDAKAVQPARFQETYLAADVEMINLYRLHDNENIYSNCIPRLCQTMIGHKNGIEYIMVLDRSLVTNIHYCGGKPWE